MRREQGSTTPQGAFTCTWPDLPWKLHHLKRNKFCRSHIAKISTIRTQIFFSIARQYKRTRRTRRGADRGMITKIFRHFYISSFSYKDPVTKTPQESEHTGASCSLRFKIKPRRGHCKSSICRVIEVYFSSLFFFLVKTCFYIYLIQPTSNTAYLPTLTSFVAFPLPFCSTLRWWSPVLSQAHYSFTHLRAQPVKRNAASGGLTC